MPSKTNTADIATLGLAPLQLVGCMFWRYGPEFLILPKTSWPKISLPKASQLRPQLCWR